MTTAEAKRISTLQAGRGAWVNSPWLGKVKVELWRSGYVVLLGTIATTGPWTLEELTPYLNGDSPQGAQEREDKSCW